MTIKQICLAVPVSLLVLGHAAVKADTTIDDAGSLACVTDKWDEKEVAKGHKLADWAARCIAIPDNPDAPKYTEECAGKYEFRPDESWKGTAKCTWKFKDGDEVHDTFEEGSHLKESTYVITGGTGKYQGASGGGIYSCETLTDVLCGGKYKGRMQLP